MSLIQCLPAELSKENVNKVVSFLRLCSKVNHTFYIMEWNLSQINLTYCVSVVPLCSSIFPTHITSSLLSEWQNKWFPTAMKIAFQIINSFGSKQILSIDSQGLTLFLTRKAWSKCQSSQRGSIDFEQASNDAFEPQWREKRKLYISFSDLSKRPENAFIWEMR